VFRAGGRPLSFYRSSLAIDHFICLTYKLFSSINWSLESIRNLNFVSRDVFFCCLIRAVDLCAFNFSLDRRCSTSIGRTARVTYVPVGLVRSPGSVLTEQDFLLKVRAAIGQALFGSRREPRQSVC